MTQQLEREDPKGEDERYSKYTKETEKYPVETNTARIALAHYRGGLGDTCVRVEPAIVGAQKSVERG